jgi:hypothetical protein
MFFQRSLTHSRETQTCPETRRLLDSIHSWKMDLFDSEVVYNAWTFLKAYVTHSCWPVNTTLSNR